MNKGSTQTEFCFLMRGGGGDGTDYQGRDIRPAMHTHKGTHAVQLDGAMTE
jgi:hypothetical protein